VLPATGAAAPQSQTSRPEDRRLERALWRRSGRPCHGRRLHLSGFFLRIHRQPFIATPASTRGTRRLAPDSATRPAGVGTARARPLPLRLQEPARLPTRPMKDDQLVPHLLYLKLSSFQEHHQALAREAVEKNWTQLDFLS